MRGGARHEVDDECFASLYPDEVDKARRRLNELHASRKKPDRLRIVNTALYISRHPSWARHATKPHDLLECPCHRCWTWRGRPENPKDRPKYGATGWGLSRRQYLYLSDDADNWIARKASERGVSKNALTREIIMDAIKRDRP
jgi:hypothetical protein